MSESRASTNCARSLEKRVSSSRNCFAVLLSNSSMIRCIASSHASQMDVHMACMAARAAVSRLGHSSSSSLSVGEVGMSWADVEVVAAVAAVVDGAL